MHWTNSKLIVKVPQVHFHMGVFLSERGGGVHLYNYQTHHKVVGAQMTCVQMQIESTA